MLHCKAACLAYELMHPSDAAGAGARSAKQGAQPQPMTPLMLWPSKTPSQVPQQQKQSSPTLASLPRPSTSLKNSREGELPSCKPLMSEPCWRTQAKLSCHRPVPVLAYTSLRPSFAHLFFCLRREAARRSLAGNSCPKTRQGILVTGIAQDCPSRPCTCEPAS